MPKWRYGTKNTSKKDKESQELNNDKKVQKKATKRKSTSKDQESEDQELDNDQEILATLKTKMVEGNYQTCLPH